MNNIICKNCNLRRATRKDYTERFAMIPMFTELENLAPGILMLFPQLRLCWHSSDVNCKEWHDEEIHEKAAT